MMLAGARGVISVTANIAPKMMHAMTDAIIHDNMVEAATLNEKLMPLHKTLFLESNPIPVKWALYKMGLIKIGHPFAFDAIFRNTSGYFVGCNEISTNYISNVRILNACLWYYILGSLFMSRQFQLKLALSFGLIAMLTGCASTHSHYLRAQTLAYLHSQKHTSDGDSSRIK